MTRGGLWILPVALSAVRATTARVIDNGYACP